MEKGKIKALVSSLSAEQLFEEIKLGNITLPELIATDGLYGKELRITELQTEFESEDDKKWEVARYGNEMALSDYITNFRTGKHVQEAKEKIVYLEEARRQAQAAKQGILNNLKNNPNTYAPDEIKSYLQNGTITREELHSSCGIPDDMIDTLNNIVPLQLELGDTPDAIPSGYTEVYFWGIPGSGKTCALAALLSTAHKAGYLKIATGPGYDYMTKLKNIFTDDNAILPPPSPVETTQYLPFTLKKANENHSRSVSLIELSGEIFQCFYYINAGKSLPTQSHQDTFDSLKRFLSGDNRKIHFFFIDYDKQNKKDANGYLQSDYLEAASTYFSKPEHKVFGKSTDAVYVVLTKSDLMKDKSGNKVPAEKRVEYAKQHLNKESFASFINTLKDNCKEHSINAGKLTVEPFSLGKVYFQHICNFDNSSANNIIEILIDRIEPSKKSILDVFNK
jgi:hypothetical protein